jgi:hypothetical protein
VFDDLLIANFVRTTLHGVRDLYPHFTPVVAKYGDNGRAFTPLQLASYFLRFFARSPIDAVADSLRRIELPDEVLRVLPFGAVALRRIVRGLDEVPLFS